MTRVRKWQVVRIDLDGEMTVVTSCRTFGAAERCALLLDVFALLLRMTGGPFWSYDVRHHLQPPPAEGRQDR